MTTEEWQACPKEPGTILYPTDGKGAGRLVSHIQYGATLDFTKEGYRHEDHAYYPFQMLAETKAEAKQKRKTHHNRD